MDAATFNETILQPNILKVAPILAPVTFSSEAQLMLLAIAGQEGGWEFRVQANNGPAHSFWQFERLGGVAGVLGDHTTSSYALKLCGELGVRPNSATIWNGMAIAALDDLSLGFARLLLWSDSAALPVLGYEDAAWEMYQRNWRPGAPSRSRWATVYPQSMTALGHTT